MKISNKRVAGGSASADVASVQPFKEELQKLIRDNDFRRYVMYNVDETGLFWKSLPNNTTASWQESSTPGLEQ
ncbi:Tigger transposable element-derived protein 7-like 73 [Homarus americanus]|uniref:Tigger transposable element-derived protein 7-like 73 n=1 Tax=Homarus americanus TaxID=6706 RepID=A0A8J5JQG0_HOMAM|nr:Tigger transposable element-derived protein 7-like 73 [Homarus americanus]